MTTNLIGLKIQILVIYQRKYLKKPLKKGKETLIIFKSMIQLFQ